MIFKFQCLMVKIHVTYYSRLVPFVFLFLIRTSPFFITKEKQKRKKKKKRKFSVSLVSPLLALSIWHMLVRSAQYTQNHNPECTIRILRRYYIIFQWMVMTATPITRYRKWKREGQKQIKMGSSAADWGKRKRRSFSTTATVGKWRQFSRL